VVSRSVWENVRGNTGTGGPGCVADTAGSLDILVGQRHQDIHVVDGKKA